MCQEGWWSLLSPYNETETKFSVRRLRKIERERARLEKYKARRILPKHTMLQKSFFLCLLLRSETLQKETLSRHNCAAVKNLSFASVCLQFGPFSLLFSCDLRIDRIVAKLLPIRMKQLKRCMTFGPVLFCLELLSRLG